MAAQANPVTLSKLCERYECILLDSYGVLVDGGGARPNAVATISAFQQRAIRFLVVTNDASRSPETSSARYRDLGMDIPPEMIVTSGSLLVEHFENHGLQGARTVVLGTSDSVAYAKQAGAVVIDPHAEAEVDAVIVADDAGYPFLPATEETLSMLVRAFERGKVPALILPNPDLIYPKDPQRFGFTSGAVALLLEAALARCFPSLAPKFLALGKPEAKIFEHARNIAGTTRLVMIGDQLETDIAGANAAGISSALLRDGVSRETSPQNNIAPTYVLSRFALDET